MMFCEFCPHCWTKLDSMLFGLSGLATYEQWRREEKITHVYHSFFRRCPVLRQHRSR